MSHKYPKGEYEYPSVTTIISDCTDKSGALTQWAANMVVQWIRQNCPKPPRGNYLSGDDFCVSEEDLDDARFHFRDISKEALDVGSEVHKAIERLLNEAIRA